MGTLASRLLGGEVLTLEQFVHEVAARLSWNIADVVVTQPRPDVIAVALGNKPAIEFTVLPSYRAYQKDPRAREQVIARFVQWVENGTR